MAAQLNAESRVSTDSTDLATGKRTKEFRTSDGRRLVTIRVHDGGSSIDYGAGYTPDPLTAQLWESLRRSMVAERHNPVLSTGHNVSADPGRPYANMARPDHWWYSPHHEYEWHDYVKNYVGEAHTFTAR